MTEQTSSKDTAKATCEILVKIPSLNEYIRVCRTNPFMASKFKKGLEEDIGFYLRDLPRFEKPIRIHFHWIEDSKRRDYDNVCAGKKFILDAMVKMGKLLDDNRKCVYAFTDTFDYGKEAKVIMEIFEED